MPEETKLGVVTPEAVAETVTETPKQAKAETAEELAARLAEVEKRLANKSEEALRLHKKNEQLEQAEQERAKAQMSETERAQRERDEAVAKAKMLETKQAQRDAAEKAGLPIAFAERLKGETPEELEADAQQLLESLPKGVKAPKTPSVTPASAETEAVTDAQRRKFLFG